jgi:hypothetical protein
MAFFLVGGRHKRDKRRFKGSRVKEFKGNSPARTLSLLNP